MEEYLRISEQQRIDEQRRRDDKEKARDTQSREEFARLVAQKRNKAADEANRKQVESGQRNARQEMLAREGIATRRVFGQMLDQQGKKNLENMNTEANLRSDDMQASEFNEKDKDVETTMVRIDRQSEEFQDRRVEAIEGDGSQNNPQGQGGGDGSNGSGDSDGEAPRDDAIAAVAGGPVNLEEAPTDVFTLAPTQQATGAQPTRQQEIIAAISKHITRALVGMNPEGHHEYSLGFEEGAFGHGVQLAGLKVISNDGRMTVLFSGADDNTRRLLLSGEAHQGLARVFEKRGLSLDRLDVLSG